MRKAEGALPLKNLVLFSSLTTSQTRLWKGMFLHQSFLSHKKRWFQLTTLGMRDLDQTNIVKVDCSRGHEN